MKHQHACINCGLVNVLNSNLSMHVYINIPNAPIMFTLNMQCRHKGLMYPINKLDRVPKNTYPVCTEHALSAEYCMCSYDCTAVKLLVFCTAHVCLASLSNLTEAEPEIPSVVIIIVT